jgi:thioredoxin reductase/ferredoxin
MVSLVSIALVAAVAVTSVLLAVWIRRPRARVAPVRLPLVHSINDDRCVGCDACIDVCPTEVLELVDNKSRVVRFEDCIGCEQCALVCPTTALVMHRQGTAPPPMRAAALDDYHQAAPGLYLVGEAAGRPLVKNASNLGRAVVEHMIQEGLRARRSGGDIVDVAIVGSGPAGLSAALSCEARGLSYVLLEKDAHVASTIANYPKGKHVMAEPYDVRCVGLLPVWDATKEELLATWQQLLRRRGVVVRTRHTVGAIERDRDGFVVRARSGDAERTFRAQRVVLGIGTRGTPRRLGVPGESLPKVSPLLRDAAAHRGQAVLVVGGGDSAVEAALALGDEAAHVTLSYRGKSLSRCKARNRQALEQAVEEGRLHVLYGSKVTEIREASLMVECGDERVELPNDHVFVCIGGDPPTRWLETLGVQFVDEPHLTQRRPSDELVESLVGPIEIVSADRSGPLAQVAAAGMVCALAFMLSGCLGDLVPYQPPGQPAPSPQSAPSTTAPSDGSAGSAPTDGGTPDDAAGLVAFQPDIMNDLTRLGCPSCHNGGPPMKLLPAPASATDWAANYAAVQQRAMNGPQSLLLTKTLAGSGVSHGGGSAFPSASDATYARWLAWINAGAPK